MDEQTKPAPVAWAIVTGIIIALALALALSAIAQGIAYELTPGKWKGGGGHRTAVPSDTILPPAHGYDLEVGD